ncbi:MAG: TrbI/VirB10 family protein [Aeromonas sp.]
MSIPAEQMTPAASPNSVSKSSGVRRVNNLPMYLFATVAALFLLVMALVAMDRASQQTRTSSAAPSKAGNSRLFAEQIVGQQRDGQVPALFTPATAQPLTMPSAAEVAVAEPILIATPDVLDAPPLPPTSAPPADSSAERIRLIKLQMLEDAIKAKTAVAIVAPRSSGRGALVTAQALAEPNTIAAQLAAVRQTLAEPAAADDRSNRYQQQLAQLSGTPPEPLALPAPAAGATPLAATDDRWQLDSQVQAPRSPFELRAGFVLPATLISGINSELPGQLMAQVSQPVYDTATGKYLLIPQGARLIGVYASDVAYGQSRVLIAWQRIVFPDGKAMDIGAMPGADGAGYAGFNDQVNNHYVRLFGSALLLSGVTAGVAISQDDGASADTGRPTLSSALTEALGQQLGQVTAQLIAKNMNVAPTLAIRPGYRFNVMVTKDLTFSKPYQAFDY